VAVRPALVVPSLTTYGICPIDADGAGTLGFCESWRKDHSPSAMTGDQTGGRRYEWLPVWRSFTSPRKTRGADSTGR
jgi:hypothetical protein